MRILNLALLLAVLAPPASADSLELQNGLWFDGSRFVHRTVFVDGSVFSDHRPAAPVRTVDLAGKFVIPPFAEAHNHWLEPARVDDYIRSYLTDGVFYVMDQANVPLVVDQFRSKVNRPDSVDYRVAILGITGPGGHPLQIVKQFVDFGVLPAAWWPDSVDRNAVLIVSNAAELADRWPLLAAAHTDFVKLFLIGSEEYQARLNDPSKLYKRGLDPKLVPMVVERAHRQGLRVSAHIYTAADFRNAVAGGVDIVAHMPGTGATEATSLEPYRITKADARLAGRRGVYVITTLDWLDELAHENPSRAAAIEKTVILPNLRLLLRHHVKLVVGSDQFRQTPIPEYLFLATLHVMDPAVLLRIATMDTPRMIFPGRDIGRLQPGYEASFLALDADPLKDAANVRRISLRVKQGLVLEVAPSPPPPSH